MADDDPGAVPVPVTVRQERIERLRTAARARDLAAVVLFSYGARAGAGTHGHLRYLLDWTSGGGCAMLLLPTRSSPPASTSGREAAKYSARTMKAHRGRKSRMVCRPSVCSSRAQTATSRLIVFRDPGLPLRVRQPGGAATICVMRHPLCGTYS